MKIDEQMREQWRLSAIKAARKFRPLFKATKHKWAAGYTDADGLHLTYTPKVHDIVRVLEELTANVEKQAKTMKRLPKGGICHGTGGLEVMLEDPDENGNVELVYRYVNEQFGWLPSHEEMIEGEA